MSEKNETEELVEYNGRRIYPEVARYLTAREGAQWAYRRAMLVAEQDRRLAQLDVEEEATKAGVRLWSSQAESYNSRMQQADEAYQQARVTAEAERNRAEGMGDLLNSPHREVAFIAKHCLREQTSEVTGHARTILSHLPAPTEEIWRIAKDEAGMCGVFDSFYQKAEEEGVFVKDGEDPFPALRELVAVRSWVSREYGERYAVRTMNKIEPALRKLHEDYLRRVEEAKAEWQGLDEAHAENVRRNRSDAARRAADTRRRNAQLRAQESASVISTQSAMTGEIIRSEIPADPTQLASTLGQNDA